MNQSQHQQQTTSINGLSQPVSAFAADFFALEQDEKPPISTTTPLSFMTAREDLQHQQQLNDNDNTKTPIEAVQQNSLQPLISNRKGTNNAPQSSPQAQSKSPRVATAALTTSSKDNRQGMLAKQSLLAKMYQNRSARAGASGRSVGGGAKPNNKASSDHEAPGSKRVFSSTTSTNHQGDSMSSSAGESKARVPTTDTTSHCQSSMSVDSLLHNSCKLYPTNLDIVRSALFFDPEAIRRQVHLAPDHNDNEHASSEQQEQSPSKKPKMTDQNCVYPINIALCHQANKQVVEFLAKAGPDVLICKDGSKQASSLAIALQADCDMGILKALLAANSQQLQIADRQNGVPLHTAVSLPTVSLDVVKLLYKAFPGALLQPNVRGETPVQVAERNIYCPESIVNYLQEQAYLPFEENAMHMNDDELLAEIQSDL